MVILRLANESDFSTIVKWTESHDADFFTQWAGRGFHYPLTVEQMMSHYRNGFNSVESGVFIYMVYYDHLEGECVGTIQDFGLEEIKLNVYDLPGFTRKKLRF